MKNMTLLTPNRQVNLEDPAPAVNGVTGSQSNPEVAALGNGNFVVVYENPYQGNAFDFDILAVEFTAAGAVIPGSILRVEADVGLQIAADVSARNGGGYAVVWSDIVDSSSVKLGIVLPGATSEPAEFDVEPGQSDRLSQPSIATFANGFHIVTYTRDASNSGDLDTRYVIVNAANIGNTFNVKNAAPIDASGSANEFNTEVAARGNLAVVVSVSEPDAAPSSDDIRLALIDSAGTIRDTKTVADVGDELANPDVAALTDGRFVIVWQHKGDSDIFGRIYDPATESFAGPSFDVDSGAGSQTEPRVAALPHGGFLVSYHDGASVISGRRFDADGAPAGDKFAVSENVGGGKADPAMAANADGKAFAVWAHLAATAGDGSPTGIQGRMMQPVTEVVDGTPGDDTIATYSLSEQINGLDGKDKIDARAGDDVVNGGEGKDKLTGGPGADAYVFDAKLKGKNVDHITDFTLGVDQLRLDQDIFKKLKVGDLAKKAFFAGKTVDEGKDDKDLVIYDKQSGKFWYDADGPGGKDAKLVAILDGSPNGLKHEDIVVVA